MARVFRGFWLGRRSYAEVHELQLALHEARKREEIGDTVLLLEHEPVITMGRGYRTGHLLASDSELAQQGVERVTIGRGGDVTLHAPGQLVCYPILDLKPDRCDVRRYVNNLSESMAQVVAEYGVGAGPLEKYVGLWVDAESPHRFPEFSALRAPVKIGAIGVRLSRWVTLHGYALNLGVDLSLFRLIVPCGIREYGVTSVKQLTGASPDTATAAQKAFESLVAIFGAQASGYHQLPDISLSFESFLT